MTDEEIKDFNRMNLIHTQKEAAFGEASALYGYQFKNDNGAVPQMAEARHYLEHWQEMRMNNLGLLFWGQSGNGKTFAAACIANALCEQMLDVRMLTLGTMLNKLPGMNLHDKEYYLASLQKCDLLIVDDFGMERRTDYAQEQVYGLINGRYLAKKPMIVTTNLSLNDLKSPETITEQRIYDRVLEMCVPICFEGGSLRRELAKEKLRTYKELTR